MDAAGGAAGVDRGQSGGDATHQCLHPPVKQAQLGAHLVGTPRSSLWEKEGDFGVGKRVRERGSQRERDLNPKP